MQSNQVEAKCDNKHISSRQELDFAYKNTDRWYRYRVPKKPDFEIARIIDYWGENGYN
jgi:hypothetical protein